MEDDIKKIEIIDQLLVNEKRSRLWTTLIILIFCLLGFLVYMFAWNLNSRNAKAVKVQKDSIENLETQKDSLKTQKDSLEMQKDDLVAQTYSLTKRAENYDSIKNVLDTVIVLFKASQANMMDSGWVVANYQIDRISERAYSSRNVVLSDNIKKEILTKVPVRATAVVYTVFMQCMPAYEKLMTDIRDQLKRLEFEVPKWEVISSVTFNSVVRYYHDEDKIEAEKVADLVNKSNAMFSQNPVRVQKVDLKSPLHQIDVWVGKYQPSQIKKLMQKSIITDYKKQK